jgi:hypothetical protein
MGTGNQTINGKAFEYACIIALCEQLDGLQEIEIVRSPQMTTARNLYASIEDEKKDSFNLAARAAVRILRKLEPQLIQPNGNEPLYLSLQTDAEGSKGDVRDVICLRKQNGWEIGLSCKHNHHAVKHSRLSDTIDFGAEWLGVPCSQEYFKKVNPLFSKLRKIRDISKQEGSSALWSDMNGKAETYYIPILQAFMEELQHIFIVSQENIPERLVRYLLGRHDFYKVIADDIHRTTRVEAINISGTLNQKSGVFKSITNVPILKMPSQFYHIGFKPGSSNTIEVICDEGWQISMRIHNASSKVESSLKFDVNLISLPTSVHTQIEPWDYDLDSMQKERLMEYAKKLLNI